uniref:WAP four-disulfide core domain 13 n=1 Tax=Jaculus jaculus TaxID=51337 RepID=A0A8C5P3A1_JACJA
MTPLLPFQLLLVVGLLSPLIPGSHKEFFLKYILEPPPCKLAPVNCNQFCTLQEDCPKELQCCSAYCGIVCTLNKF